MIEVSLIGFPTATKVKVEGQIVIRECAPGQFEAPFIEDQLVIVGDK